MRLWPFGKKESPASSAKAALIALVVAELPWKCTGSGYAIVMMSDIDTDRRRSIMNECYARAMVRPMRSPSLGGLGLVAMDSELARAIGKAKPDQFRETPLTPLSEAPGEEMSHSSALERRKQREQQSGPDLFGR